MREPFRSPEHRPNRPRCRKGLAEGTDLPLDCPSRGPGCALQSSHPEVAGLTDLYKASGVILQEDASIVRPFQRVSYVADDEVISVAPAMQIPTSVMRRTNRESRVYVRACNAGTDRRPHARHARTY